MRQASCSSTFRLASFVTVITVALFGGLGGCADAGLPLDYEAAPDLGVDLAECSEPECERPCKTSKECPAGLVCDPLLGRCVGCVADSECSPGLRCHGRTSRCMPGCDPKLGCGPDGGICEADAGLCVECAADSDCRDAARPRCEPASRRCAACLADPDTCGAASYCATGLPGGSECLPGCEDDADCAGQSGTLCDRARHLCVKCRADGDCPSGQKCASGQCGCGAGSACMPKQTRTMACGNCGTQTDTCDAGCQWQIGTCQAQGACAPSAKQAGGCDACSEQACGANCQWGACALKAGNACDWRSGTHTRACGCAMACAGSPRQWCLSTCQWSTFCSCCTNLGCDRCL